MSDFKISQKEFVFSLALAILGYFLSSKSWILWLDKLSPFKGLLVYYGFWFGFYFILSLYGLKLFDIQVKSAKQIFGLILITFSIFLVFNWENAYVQQTTKNNIEGASNIFYQSEDGSTWDFWFNKLGIKDIETTRILTFVITPFVLSLLGGLLVTRPRILF